MRRQLRRVRSPRFRFVQPESISASLASSRKTDQFGKRGEFDLFRIDLPFLLNVDIFSSRASDLSAPG